PHRRSEVLPCGEVRFLLEAATSDSRETSSLDDSVELWYWTRRQRSCPAVGRVTWTTSPPPSRGIASTVPPWTCVTERTMESRGPDPAPEPIRSVAFRKGSNSRGRLAGETTGPVFVTVSRASPSP